MGADYQGQEAGLEQLRALPKEAKEFLFHHAGNALSVVTMALWMVRNEIEAGIVPDARRVDHAIEATKHAMEDLRRIERPMPLFEELRAAMECDAHPAVCDCMYHEAVRAARVAEASHRHGEAA